ncbi:MAG: amidohydrolase family protein [Candidatus Solibacter usitatus]|nr:amidohydrolase family protein [Candidatus Solibacter usitatus]
MLTGTRRHAGLRAAFWLPVFFFLLLSGCKPPEESNQKAIIGAVLIDGRGGPPISDSVVIVAGSRIRAAGPRASVPIPAGTEKIDGSGKFLVPGLIDLHVHPGARGGPVYVGADHTAERIERNLNAYLYFGVTSVRSMGTDLPPAFAVRKAERDGTLATTRLFTAGAGFTAPGGPPSQEVGHIVNETNSPDDARKRVAALAAQNVDAIKIWVDGPPALKIKRPVIEAILDEARKFQIPVTAHIATLSDTQHLVDNGAAGFMHMVRDTEDVSPEFLARLRSLSTVFTPTLVRQELAWLYTEHPELLDDPDVARSVEADRVAGVKAAARAAKASAADREEFDRAMRNTRKFAAAGVLIGVGSDGGSASDFPGLMTHREMALLAEAGLAPMDVIVAATRTGAVALGKLADLGTIEPGKLADLFLVTANPLEDVRNLRKIQAVMLNGQWVDRAGLKLK